MFLNSLLSVSSSLGGGGGKRNQSSSSTTTTPTPADIQVTQELRARGVNATDQLNGASRDLILAWIGWFDHQTGVGPGALVHGIRSGQEPPATLEPESLLDRQRRYGIARVAWLVRHMPDVCKPNPRVVELERRVFGDGLADRLATCDSPHPAALAALIALHHRGKVTAKEHGQEIRAAVKAADEEAIADYEAIEQKRDQDRERNQSMTSRPHLVAIEMGGDEQ